MRSLRSKAFQLSLQTTIISGLGGAILSTAVYYDAETTIKGQLDNAIRNEQVEIMSGSNGTETSIEDGIQEEINESSGLFYALLRPSGRMLAGNVTVTAEQIGKWNRYKTLKPRDGLKLPFHVLAVRGMAKKLDNGDVLYIAEKANELIALDDFFSYSFLILDGGILCIGMVGGFFVARSALRRVEAITRTSREIMAGNLAQRIGVDGSGDEFDQLGISLNLMLDRIVILMQNMRQISNDISHDLRLPLARLRDTLDISRDMNKDAAMRPCFDDAINQVDTVLDIFSAMLRLAEIETHAMRSHFASVDLSALLHDVAETLAVVASSEQKIVHTDITAHLCVVGDRELLEQMFVNIIENAILYSHPASRISIRARLNQRGDVEVEITDQGPGIPAHERQRVMQRFVRLDASRHTPGTGLGLALVAAIADVHNALISFADNNPGLKVLIQFTRSKVTV